MPTSEQIIDALLSKCVESHDCDAANAVEKLAKAQRETLADATYSLLIKAYKPGQATRVVQEVLIRESSAFSPDLASSILDFCVATSNVAVADQLLKKMKPMQVKVVSSFIGFYIGVEEFEKACDTYETDFQRASNGRPDAMDASLHENIVDAAVLCGRTHLAERLVANSPPRSESKGPLALLSHASELFSALLAVLEKWNSMVSYWVVLIF